MFHISHLKPQKGSVSVAMILLSHTFDNHPLLHPTAIMDKLTLQNDSKTIEQVLVLWDGFALEEATWETLDDFEDKVMAEGEGYDAVSITD